MAGPLRRGLALLRSPRRTGLGSLGQQLLAEQQRRGVFLGLALTSALVVLLGSGVAISRLGSDDRSNADGETVAAPSAPTPTGVEGEAAAASGPANSGAADPGATAAAGDGSSASQPATGPTGGRRTARVAAPGSAGSSSAVASGSVSSGEATEPDGTGSGSSGGSAEPGGTGGSGFVQPAPKPAPAPLLSASVSAGEGANGAVVGIGLGNSPDADVTVGTNQLVGDAPPSSGTGVELGGTVAPSSVAPPG
jgi:hypothetical protein